MTVVGVAADIKRYSLTEIPRPEMIVPYTQRPYPTFTAMQLVVRSTLGPTELLPAVRCAVAEVDPGVPVSKVRTIEELVGETTAQARFATRFMAGFGAASLLLAMIGLYGVIAYGVHQRRQEFGVRGHWAPVRRESCGWWCSRGGTWRWRGWCWVCSAPWPRAGCSSTCCTRSRRWTR